VFDKESDESAGRDRLIQLARTEHGYRLAEIARFLGIDRSTASRAVTRWQQKNAAGADGEAG
jgi:DNA-binding IclR family transcriptional regulator